MDRQLSGAAAEHTATLLRLALQLREAAADADRPDVVAEVDELLGLLAGEKISAGPGAGNAGPGVAETVPRILNGLGL